jgi:hypothetical protein
MFFLKINNDNYKLIKCTNFFLFNALIRTTYLDCNPYHFLRQFPSWTQKKGNRVIRSSCLSTDMMMTESLIKSLSKYRTDDEIRMILLLYVSLSFSNPLLNHQSGQVVVTFLLGWSEIWWTVNVRQVMMLWVNNKSLTFPLFQQTEKCDLSAFLYKIYHLSLYCLYIERGNVSQWRSLLKENLLLHATCNAIN